MPFSPLTFVVFFAIVLALHHPRPSRRHKKVHPFVASYPCRAAWNPPFVAVLRISTAVDRAVAGAGVAQRPGLDS